MENCRALLQMPKGCVFSVNEKDIIATISKLMPRSPLQVNKLFESDSEIIKIGDGYQLFNIDEFSHEDMFCEKKGYDLGWNVTVGTLSDIYASGGTPQYFGCSLTINNKFDTAGFAEGMADVLNQENINFIGGDLGKAKEWRATCFAVGVSENPIMRSGAQIGNNIYITGEVGAGNLMAIGASCRLSLRKLPAGVTACIDTSDGVWNGINTIAEQSGVGFKIANIPYIEKSMEICKKLRLPKEMLFFCECGEYEFLFTSPHELPFAKLGKITETEKILDDKDVSGFDISARDYKYAINYIRAVKRKCAEL